MPVDDLTFALGKFTAVPVLFAVVLTALACPVILLLYRARATRWMRASSTLAGWPDPVPPATDVPIRWSVAAGAVDGLSNPLASRVAGGVRRRALACAAGGVASAMLSTVLFGAAFSGSVSATILSAVFGVFCLPAVLIAGHVAGRAKGTVAAVSACGGLLLLLGPLGELGFLVAGAFIAAPALIFAIFALRFWRGVAPYVLIITLGASLLWVIGADVGSRWFGGAPAIVWALRLVGFAAGLWLGYAALQRIQRAWEAGSVADEDIFVDGWWALYVLIQTLVFVLMAGPAFFVGLAGFPLYSTSRQYAGRRLAPRTSPHRPVTLLLLRVFRGDTRADRLLDRLQRQWRGIGPIALIAAADVALRLIRPTDFVAFITGRLRQRFVASVAELDERLTDRLSRHDAAGDYPVTWLWCHRDTWRPVMRELAARSDVVLMDLRGFTPERSGVLEEMRHLAQTAPRKPVVFIVENERELQRVTAVIPALVTNDAAWTVLQAGSVRHSRMDAAILSRLAAAAVSQPPGPPVQARPA